MVPVCDPLLLSVGWTQGLPASDQIALGGFYRGCPLVPEWSQPPGYKLS